MASPATTTTPLPPPPREPTTAHAYLLPILSLLSILILIVPFIFHLRARNTGACALIAYLTLFNLMVFTNILIWHDNNFADWWDGAILCDIEVKLTWPITVGVAASTMAITRSLAIVLDVENAELNPSKAQRRRKVLVDLAICFAVPLLIVGLHHVVHNRRYLIVAIGGCTDSYSGSWVSILIIWIWPLVFTLINVYYAALVLTRLHRHRYSISTILSTHSLNTSHFLRLLLLSLLLLLIYLPINIYYFYINLSQPLEPFSWAAVHDPAVWAVIPYVPAKGVFTFDRYVPVAMAGFVFAFFGVGTEARRIYAVIFVAVGLGVCFPRLLRERRPSVDEGGRGGWLDKLSLVAVGKRYLARFGSREGSQAATEMTSTTTRTSSSRKPSAAGFEEEDIAAAAPPSFTFQTSHASSSSPPPSISPITTTTTVAATASPFPPHKPSLLTRLLTSLHISPRRGNGTTGAGGRGAGGAGTNRATSSTRGADTDMEMDTETHDLVHRQGSRTHVWSPRSLVPGDQGAGGGEGGRGDGRFERLGSVGSEGTEGTDGLGVGEGEVKVRTRVGVRVERV
ncbi:hypothetical protein VE00_06314 [Pseudogymnoascus sp. WSF 3629]|nr:hypothetical protein VE00_06314 [Pseudogymnoascus sp. WSF 3629]